MTHGTEDMTETAQPPELPQAELLVCVKCRRGREIPADERRPGQRLFEALTATQAPHGLRVTPVDCLQNCDFGCTVALRGGARWTYVFANVDEVSHPDMILDGARRYQQTQDGLIPWRERPEHFKRNCVARIPPQESEHD
ncbi:DUF1636 family protein [Thalassococcus sp. BH17M4-6]|uniref:DUF1636 family protein n=1 Tax=Thalassococcus sp. BH17M4-6 TaxID=3413148 RepID=UPI003BC6EF48